MESPWSPVKTIVSSSLPTRWHPSYKILLFIAHSTVTPWWKTCKEVQMYLCRKYWKLSFGFCFFLNPLSTVSPICIPAALWLALKESGLLLQNYFISKSPHFPPGCSGWIPWEKKQQKKLQRTEATTVSVADVGIVECGRCVGAKGNRIMKYLWALPA